MGSSIRIFIALIMVSCTLLVFSSEHPYPKSSAPLRNAHAHNDYNHPRPLWDALEHGFTSVEADIILRHDSLYVAHDPEDIVPGRTLQSLYLDPLFGLYEQHGDAVQPNWPTFYLMIDVKSHADSTYRALRTELRCYADMLTSWQNGDRVDGAVMIILSGNRPIDMVRREKRRLVGLDGRLEDLQHNVSSSLYPWISDNWTTHFQWRGVGTISKSEWHTLTSLVQHAHDNGHLVRFWATDAPSLSARDNMWTTLLQAKVDLVNADDLSGLRTYLMARP